MTVAQLIDLAFIDLGVIQPGEIISSDMLANAFIILNAMIGNWSAERTMAYAVVHQNFTPIAGNSIYTVGVGATFGTASRPVRITGWNAGTGNFSTGGTIMDFDQFRAKTLNATGRTSTLPEMIAADQAFPQINLEIFPTPSVNPGLLRLDFWVPFAAFTNTGSTVSYADEYTAALHFNLAVALAPQYSRTSGITPELAANAQNSKAVIMQKNAEILGLSQPAQAAPQQ